jgi:hypothetical protein
MQQLLRNVRVATRLPLLVALALAGLVLFALISLSTLNRVRVGGPEEQRVTEQNLLFSDLALPDAYLVAADHAALELECRAARMALRGQVSGRRRPLPRRRGTTSEDGGCRGAVIAALAGPSDATLPSAVHISTVDLGGGSAVDPNEGRHHNPVGDHDRMQVATPG